MLRDPSSVDTAPATLKALREHGVVGRAVEGLVRVVPWGDDGEMGADEEGEGDVDFEEKVVGWV